MKTCRFATLIMTTVLTLGLSSYTSARTLSCESNDGTTLRHWLLDNAYACSPGKGDPSSSADIEAVGSPFNFETWQTDEQITSDLDASASLDIELVVGGWDEKNVFATWTLAPGFWDEHDIAVFSFHVGDNSEEGLSDFATFIITPGEYSGTLFYTQVNSTGEETGAGGLSNIRLWTPEKADRDS
ncbi:MAG: hypothetical protein V4628_14345 [Pseudomonadota bacterium]